MNNLSKFRISEDFKDYFSSINRDAGDFKLSDRAIEATGPLIAETHAHFQEIRKDKNAVEAVRYLWDVCGYYIALCSEYQDHNKELIDLLKETMDRLPDD